MPPASRKTEGGRVGKKLGETSARSTEDIINAVGSDGFGELVNGIFAGAGGAKRVGKRIGQKLLVKNLPRGERMELEKMVGNFALNHARMNPNIGSEELARLKDEQILLMLKKEFGLAPLKEVSDGPGTIATSTDAD